MQTDIEDDIFIDPQTSPRSAARDDVVRLLTGTSERNLLDKLPRSSLLYPEAREAGAVGVRAHIFQIMGVVPL